MTLLYERPGLVIEKMSRREFTEREAYRCFTTPEKMNSIAAIVECRCGMGGCDGWVVVPKNSREAMRGYAN